jgi:Gram-negative bacterial TonB protein C-terminal
MRRSIIVGAVLTFCSVLFLCTPALPQKHSVTSRLPNQFVIGRHTFFDFGPPTDFYELFILGPAVSGTSINRITLIPPGNICIAPAKFQIVSTLLKGTPAELLGSTNPCTIPEKELRRELKRCKNCLVFSGVKVLMQVQCGTQTRVIRSDILDRDMFDPTTKTPQHTSWSIELLRKMDLAVGPGVIDTERIFPIPEADQQPASVSDSGIEQDLGAGKYDALFQGAPDKPSDLFRASQIPQPLPKVKLVSSVPLQPEVFVQPVYPPLARMARIEGALSFKFAVDSDGGTTNLTFESGHPLLRGAVAEAVNRWRFPKDSAGQEIDSKIEFVLNCPTQSK